MAESKEKKTKESKIKSKEKGTKSTRSSKVVTIATIDKTPRQTRSTRSTVTRRPTSQTSQPPSENKQEIIAQFQVKQGDTGSPEVQIALLTKRIEKLVSHLKTNPSDNHSRRGLLGIVSKRRRLLNYLEKKDEKRFTMIARKLGLAK